MAELRVAFLTGQSAPGQCGLSPEQATFLEALQDEGVELVRTNFPWRGARAEWRDVPVLRASIANGRQYLAARRGRVANAALAGAWLAEGARTLLLAGSCGVALLDALDPPPDVRARLHLFAYGAVARRWPPGIPGMAVIGRRDRIARWLAPSDGPRPCIVEAGHLDYLVSSAVLALAREELARMRGAPLRVR